MAVANADEYAYAPDGSIDGAPAKFLPEPGTEWGNTLLGGFTGVGDWNTEDYTTNTSTSFLLFPDTLSGQGSELDSGYASGAITYWNFSNDLFTVSSNLSDPGGLAPGSVIDLTNLEGESDNFVFANEFIDAAAGSTTPGITDILFTPTGEIPLF